MRLLTLAIVLAAVLLAGCEGRDGADGEGDRPKEVTAENEAGQSLTLLRPDDVTVVQDSKAMVTVRIKRNNLAGPVAIRFSNLPSDVDIEEEGGSVDVGPVNVEWKEGKMHMTGDTATFTLDADDDAPLGTAEVTVSAIAPDGTSVEQTFNLTVTAAGQ